MNNENNHQQQEIEQGEIMTNSKVTHKKKQDFVNIISEIRTKDRVFLKIRHPRNPNYTYCKLGIDFSSVNFDPKHNNIYLT